MSKSPIEENNRILDARKGKNDEEKLAIRNRINRIVKGANGNTSKYIPAKYGYGVNGPQKY